MRKVSRLLTLAVFTASLAAGCGGGTKEILRFGDSDERNPGPCPRAFALYEAARIVEFKDEKQRFANVGFTGEIQNVRSLCRYFGERPIIGDVDITFDLGRGPAAQDIRTARYEYFIAVTRKNIAVIDKAVFPLDVTFPAGKDRVRVVETIDEIVIPRATEGTSGENFEIIVGFQLTPSQREFNAEGRRFRVTAGQNRTSVPPNEQPSKTDTEADINSDINSGDAVQNNKDNTDIDTQESE